MDAALALPAVFRYLTPAVAKTYVVTFRSHNDDRPSKLQRSSLCSYIPCIRLDTPFGMNFPPVFP